MTSTEASHKITVVTVCYNAAKEIEKTILSVLDQTYSNIEYIIVDGGSDDGTLDIIKKYSSRISRIVSEPDNGIFDAMNKAIGMATGDYISFMNAGDLFFDGNVLQEVFGGRRYNEDVLYGHTLLRYNSGYKLQRALDSSRMPYCMPFCHQSSFTKVSALRKHLFDTTFLSVADCMFFRWLYRNGGTFRNVNRLIAVYDMYGYVSNKSLKCYFESCLVDAQKPTLKGYFAKIIRIIFKPIRYCGLRFRYSEKKRPDKYSRNRDSFKQIKD